MHQEDLSPEMLASKSCCHSNYKSKSKTKTISMSTNRKKEVERAPKRSLVLKKTNKKSRKKKLEVQVQGRGKWELQVQGRWKLRRQWSSGSLLIISSSFNGFYDSHDDDEAHTQMFRLLCSPSMNSCWI